MRSGRAIIALFWCSRVGPEDPADGLREPPAQAMGMHLVHSGPVVTHRLASGAQPAGQQVCANAGNIIAYAKTGITSLRYPMPFPSLTPIWGGKLVLAPSRRDTAAEIVEHKINILDHCQAARSRGTNRTYAMRRFSHAPLCAVNRELSTVLCLWNILASDAVGLFGSVQESATLGLISETVGTKKGRPL